MPPDRQKWGKPGELGRGAGTPGAPAGWPWEGEGAGKASHEELFAEGKKHCSSFGHNCSDFAKLVLGKQLCLSPFGASPALFILGAQAICCKDTHPVNHHSYFSGTEDV